MEMYSKIHFDYRGNEISTSKSSSDKRNPLIARVAIIDKRYTINKNKLPVLQFYRIIIIIH